jgi:Fe-S-cluster containining protein
MKEIPIEKFRESISDKVTNMGYDVCKGNCIDCCSLFTPISYEEYKKLKRLAQKYYDRVQANIDYMSAIAINCHCFFADPAKKECIIYNEFMPGICKTFHCDKNKMQLPPYLGKDRRMMYEVFDIPEDNGLALLKVLNGDKCNKLHFTEPK